jgi:PAS domain S-box-containing protein
MDEEPAPPEQDRPDNEAMRDTGDGYRAFFEALESGFCVVEVDLKAPGGQVDYRVVEANAAFYRETGFPEAIFGCWLREAAPSLEEHWFEIYGRVARTGRPEHFEQHSDHLGRWFDVYASRIDDPADHRVAIFFNDISARRLAEAQVRESESRFRNLADSAPVMMWVTDPTGFCTYLNRRWYDYTGQEMGAGEGYGWLDAVHPDDRAIAEQAFVSANAERRDYRVDFRVRRADGVYRWTIDAAAARFGEDGEYLGYVGSVIDIDERREAELALETSEERLRLATDHAEIGFWDVDLVHDKLIWPPRVKKMFGISADAPISMTDFYDGLHPEDREATAMAFASACDPAQRALYEVEYRTVGKEDGQLRWVAARGRGIFDGDQCIRVVGVAVDISDRKRTEIALQESEARVRALTDNLPSGMVYQISTGPNGQDRKFLYVSQSHEKLTGVPAEAVLADSTLPYKLILPEDLARLALAETRAIEENRPLDEEARFKRLDGQIRWCRIISAPRRQLDGSLIWDGIQIDITEQKEAETRLRELNEGLEQRVSEEVGKRASAEEALRQSQKLEAMGQLTGGVAHDFNNLLSPIMGSLDLLQSKGVGDDRDHRLIDGAMQSAERARTLVQRLLAFARRQPLQPVAVDLKQVVEGMAELLSSTTGPQVKVAVEVADDLPPAMADPNQLEMALLNLAVNARDAMPNGGTLRLSTSLADKGDLPAELKSGDYLKLSVADTGVGMDKSTLARAIEPFFSTKGVGKGTGLGLSMVHGLATQLAGTLTIHSRPGMGTNVELWLPVTTAKSAGSAKPQELLDGRERQGTVLLVDDEELVRASTAAMLSELGFSVLEAGSAEQAIGLMDGGLTPDFLVTDHLMPGMSGTELARVVQTTMPATGLLIISGYAEVDGVASDLPRLTKPFRQEQLAAMLSRNAA